MAVELFIGRRYLRAKQKQAFISLITFLSVAGVTVGVMALIIVLAVMAGFEKDLKSKILNVNAHITLQSLTPMVDYRRVIETVTQTPGVESATPLIEDQAMLSFGSSRTSAAQIRGVDLPTAGRVFKNLDTDPLIEHEKNRQEDPNLKPGIILGKDLADYLGISEGNTVHLITSRGKPSPIGIIPAPAKPYQVVGLFESGMYEYDRYLSFTSLSDAQKLKGMDDEVNIIEICVDDIYQAASIREKLMETLGFGFYSMDWTEKNKNLWSALELEKAVMFIILTLIVMVAAFNIASTLIMMVMEKKKDIAILRAMGATDRQVRRIFVFKGMVIGLIGTLLGDCLGIILCELLKRYQFIELPSDVYFISKLPADWQTLDVVTISLAALVICFLATLYPAHQASRMNPVEAIRNA